MRWKWKLRLFMVGAVEIPILLWTGVILRLPTEVVASLAGVLTALLVAMLLFRPILFVLMGVWLLGSVGSAAYFLRYLPPMLALGAGSVLSTVACAIGAPALRWIPRLLLRRHT